MEKEIEQIGLKKMSYGRQQLPSRKELTCCMTAWVEQSTTIGIKRRAHDICIV
ncbi:hypothetical protein [Desulfogranum japonicum]|uniref:hypothetical protein n=1 Tax=Desulfogranum japonicum TaxID=231447 RepID=UPI0004146FB7|nr:hypothetical protein [Desulfogranum japonicum]